MTLLAISRCSYVTLTFGRLGIGPEKFTIKTGLALGRIGCDVLQEILLNLSLQTAPHFEVNSVQFCHAMS